MAVNEAYRVWHGLTHMDDALQAPLNFQHFDGYRMGASTDTKYKAPRAHPGARRRRLVRRRRLRHPGRVARRDAHDLRRHLGELQTPADQTFVDQATRFVDIHRPDGKPDILQQVEHGTLAVAAQYRSLGQLNQGIVDSHLHTYQHLGDAATQTDNLLYDPSLKPYQVEGNRSGTPDDGGSSPCISPS